jgi:hypothetical protein
MKESKITDEKMGGGWDSEESLILPPCFDRGSFCEEIQ